MKRVKSIFIIILLVTVICVISIIYIPTKINTAAYYWGTSGGIVYEIQKRLKGWGYYNDTVDGIYGTKTTLAVEKFQQKNSLKVDGVAGDSTLKKMGIYDKKTVTSTNVSTVYTWGSRGDIVKQIQTKLKSWGYSQGTVDGVYGYSTWEGVKMFQSKNGLTPDGVAGPATLNKMGIYLKKQNTTSTQNQSKPVSSNNVNRDVYIMAAAINGEARGEPYLGMVAVGAVIMNRARHGKFPNTVAGVIYQPGAFDAVSDGQIKLKPSDQAIKAAKDSLNGWDPTGGCIYYWNPATATSKWIWSRQIVTKIGKHNFGK